MSILSPQHKAMAVRALDGVIEHGDENVLDGYIAFLRQSLTGVEGVLPERSLGVSCQCIVESARRLITIGADSEAMGCLVIRELERAKPHAQGTDLSYIDCWIKRIAEAIEIEITSA